MRVWVPGHVYHVAGYDKVGEQSITFMCRTGEGYPGNKEAFGGTNCQELLRVLIDRVYYLDQQVESFWNKLIIRSLQYALWCFEKRAQERHGKSGTLVLDNIEELPACTTCGHVEPVCACDPSWRYPW